MVQVRRTQQFFLPKVSPYAYLAAFLTTILFSISQILNESASLGQPASCSYSVRSQCFEVFEKMYSASGGELHEADHSLEKHLPPAR